MCLDCLFFVIFAVWYLAETPMLQHMHSFTLRYCVKLDLCQGTLQLDMVLLLQYPAITKTYQSDIIICLCPTCQFFIDRKCPAIKNRQEVIVLDRVLLTQQSHMTMKECLTWQVLLMMCAQCTMHASEYWVFDCYSTITKLWCCQDVISDICSMVETKDPLSTGGALEVWGWVIEQLIKLSLELNLATQKPLNTGYPNRWVIGFHRPK